MIETQNRSNQKVENKDSDIKLTDKELKEMEINRQKRKYNERFNQYNHIYDIVKSRDEVMWRKYSIIFTIFSGLFIFHGILISSSITIINNENNNFESIHLYLVLGLGILISISQLLIGCFWKKITDISKKNMKMWSTQLRFQEFIIEKEVELDNYYKQFTIGDLIRNYVKFSSDKEKHLNEICNVIKEHNPFKKTQEKQDLTLDKIEGLIKPILDNPTEDEKEKISISDYTKRINLVMIGMPIIFFALYILIFVCFFIFS